MTVIVWHIPYYSLLRFFLYGPKTFPHTFWNTFYFIRHIRWFEFLWLQTVKPRCKYDMHLRDFSSSSKGQNIICGAIKGHHLIKTTVYIYISTHCLTEQQTNHIFCLTEPVNRNRGHEDTWWTRVITSLYESCDWLCKGMIRMILMRLSLCLILLLWKAVNIII